MTQLNAIHQELHNEMKKVVVGQTKMIDELFITLLCNGHALLEGVPGVAKTLTASVMAKLIQTDFTRIQFTPDLMPADVVGTKVFEFQSSAFRTEQGPIFSNIVLIDEVNRAPAKTQASLLEVMEERQVTIEGETFEMSYPFMVIATQNPIEFEGTYSLPEAQMDRFLMKIDVPYPTEETELEILNRIHSGALKVGKERSEVDFNPVLNVETLRQLQEQLIQVKVDQGILTYINQIIRSTRMHQYLMVGSSPRGSISLLLASKAKAALMGRDYINPDDVKEMALPVLRHRVVLNPEAEIEGLTTDAVLKDIAANVSVPR